MAKVKDIQKDASEKTIKESFFDYNKYSYDVIESYLDYVFSRSVI